MGIFGWSKWHLHWDWDELVLASASTGATVSSESELSFSAGTLDMTASATSIQFQWKKLCMSSLVCIMIIIWFLIVKFVISLLYLFVCCWWKSRTKILFSHWGFMESCNYIYTFTLLTVRITMFDAFIQTVYSTITVILLSLLNSIVNCAVSVLIVIIKSTILEIKCYQGSILTPIWNDYKSLENEL